MYLPRRPAAGAPASNLEQDGPARLVVEYPEVRGQSGLGGPFPEEGKTEGMEGARRDCCRLLLAKGPGKTGPELARGPCS